MCRDRGGAGAALALCLFVGVREDLEDEVTSAASHPGLTQVSAYVGEVLEIEVPVPVVGGGDPGRPLAHPVEARPGIETQQADRGEQ